MSYCGYPAFDDGYVFTQTRSIGDRAASILSVVGSPMSLQEILERCWEERSPGSLRNAMSTDDRFDRVDRDRWALAEWGLESYTGIRALVRQEVARGGGQMAMADLIERITGKYSVSASSVVAYASAPPFDANGGIVRPAVTDCGVQKSPSRTRRLYRRDGDWLYRVKITKDHLRGSGSVAPGAIAGILGLQYGQTRLLESELEPQSIYWTGVQPGFGSIRRFLIAADIAIDSEIFLVIAADGTFHTEVVETAVDALHQALAMVGARDAQSRREPRRALALAIGLPENSLAASVIGGYRERGDSDIAELLITVRDQLGDDPVLRPAPSTEIDEIMSLL